MKTPNQIRFRRVLLHPFRRTKYRLITPCKDSPERWSTIDIGNGKKYTVAWNDPMHNPTRVAYDAILREKKELPFLPVALDIYPKDHTPRGVLWIPHPNKPDSAIAAHCHRIEENPKRRHEPVLTVPHPKRMRIAGIATEIPQTQLLVVMEDIINAQEPDAHNGRKVSRARRTGSSATAKLARKRHEEMVSVYRRIQTQNPGAKKTWIQSQTQSQLKQSGHPCCLRTIEKATRGL